MTSRDRVREIADSVPIYGTTKTQDAIESAILQAVREFAEIRLIGSGSEAMHDSDGFTERVVRVGEIRAALAELESK